MNLKPISLLGFFVLSLSLSIFSCDRDASRDYFRDADFNAQWQFHMGDISDPTKAGENWEMVKRHSYVFGDFVWTGMYYIGESGIGHNDFIDEQSRQQISFLKPWPWYVSWCGDIDILGNKKPQSHYRDVLWGESKLEVMAVRPVPEGKSTWISYWGWVDELNSWN
jgi:beta-galactosidase